MPRVTLVGLLTRLRPGMSLEQAQQELAQEASWLRALEHEATRLQALCQREREHWPLVVVGTDEVGRGPLAGPLMAAAVAFRSPPFIPGLKDSKQLSPQERELLVPWVERCALAFRVTRVEASEVSRGNLHHLSLGAMAQAVRGLGIEADRVLVDGKYPLPLPGPPQQPLIKGDRCCAAIAAASILAKVCRDREMERLGGDYPGYGFETHKGYATADHLAALQKLGPSPIHRTNFAPVRNCQGGQGELF